MLSDVCNTSKFRVGTQADQSGTIEAAEFIGPLSRWAHDSKTAPRFIKYNMLQTMQIQEDLYDMCADCFRHLALQIDKVGVEVKSISKKMARKPEKNSEKAEGNGVWSDEVKPQSEATETGLDQGDRGDCRDRPFKERVSLGDGFGGGFYPGLPVEPHPSLLEEPDHISETSERLSQRSGSEDVGFLSPDSPDSPASHSQHSKIFNMDLHAEMEHVMALRPSLRPTMLTETLNCILLKL